MAVAPPEKPRAKNLYKLSFAVICALSLTTIVSIGIRQYQAAARADATQKGLQDSMGEIRKQLESADVSRRLTGEGYLETKRLKVFRGTFVPGNTFTVNIETHNPSPGRITDPLIASWMQLLEVDNDADRKVRERFDELIKPYRAEYLSRTPPAPEAMGRPQPDHLIWATRQIQLEDGDVEALVKDTKRLYIFIFYCWTDSQGRKVCASDCKRLQASTLPTEYQNEDVIWINCREDVLQSTATSN